MSEPIVPDPQITFFDTHWHAFRARLLRQRQIVSFRATIAEATVAEADPDPLVAAWARLRRAMHERWLADEEAKDE